MKRSHFPLALFGRWTCLGIAVLGLLSVHSTKANFEVPYLDSTNAISTAEFHGVWMFNRGYKSQFASQQLFSGFEAYAVGIDTTNTQIVNNLHTNGVFYYYNGSSWSRVATPMGTVGATTPAMHSVNAIVGQADAQEGNVFKLVMVGERAQVHSAVLQDNPGNTSYAGKNVFFPNAIKDGVTGNLDPTETRDLYAIDTVQAYNGYYLAGGQAGLYIRSVTTDPNAVRFVPTISGDGSRTTLHANENITGVRFANLSTAYILTSTFADGNRYSTPGKTCAGNQTSRLYKAAPVSGSATDYLQWQYLGQIPHCGYGLATGQRFDDSPDNGPTRNLIWIATSNGMYSFDERTGGGMNGPLQGTSGKKLYSVTATPERNGQGVNLLYNGTMENWIGSNPDNWIQYQFLKGRNSGGGWDDGTCSANIRDVKRVTGYNSSNAVQVWPGAAFSTDTCLPNTYKNGATMAVFNRVDLSTTEGQVYKISGDYKVEFPAPPAVDNGLSLAAAQGGVSVACSGPIVRDFPNYIGCSYQNRSLIRTIGNPTNGWQHFELTITRNNNQFGSIIYRLNNANSFLLQQRRMNLEVRCEATFGAKVVCDNLTVTEVSNPPLQPQDTFIVTAVGQDRALLQSPDALASTPVFTAEQQPVFTSAAGPSVDYTSVFGVAAQHVMAVGESSTLLSRTPSTLKGYIWAGTVDQATIAGQSTPPGLGAISVSCINRTDRIGGQDQTLCQQESSSYGLQLSVKDDGTGELTGRAWFGKTIGSISDDEQRIAGSCQQNTHLADPTNLVGQGTYSSVYDLHGICNTVARRCYASRAEAPVAGGNGALSNISCLSDFDCYGRCQNDQGTLCVVNNDCNLGSSSEPSFSLPSSTTFNPLSASPVTKLTCTSGSILGCTAVGWLSFDGKDFISSAQQAPDGTTIGVQYNTEHEGHNSAAAINNQGGHEFSGWARFMTLANPLDPNYVNSGWVRFRGPDVAAQGKLFACQDCYGSDLNSLNCAFCRDDAGHSCTPTDTPGTGASQAQCHKSCLNNPTTNCVTDNDCPVGDSCKAVGYCTKDVSVRCTADTTCSSANLGSCALGAICNTANASCQQYGVNKSTETGQFSGYAWSDDFGWLDFRYVAQANSRFFQTRLGDIYARGSVGNPLSTQPTGVNNCNATFLILSSDTIASNWCSAIQTPASQANIQAKQPFSTPLQLPSSANVYRNVLGRFDLVGIERVVSAGRNKYGSPVVPLSPAGANISVAWGAAIGATNPLGGKVYTVGDGTSSYSIDSTMVFNASNNLTTSGSGAGILVVNGNLTINAGLSYGPTSGLNDVRKLQNLVIVVKGNLTIDNSVENLVGSYYVTGSFHTTSSSVGSNQFPLVLRGLVIAKIFDLGRTFAGTVENPAPSEVIIADGRIQANPMPGMTDFVKSLPALTAQP